MPPGASFRPDAPREGRLLQHSLPPAPSMLHSWGRGSLPCGTPQGTPESWFREQKSTGLAGKQLAAAERKQAGAQG